MTPERRRRFPVGLTRDEKAEIQRRAKAHGMSAAAYLRRAALGTHGAPPDDPDVWWDTKTPKRKKQIMRWESKRKKRPQHIGPTLPFEDPV